MTPRPRALALAVLATLAFAAGGSAQTEAELRSTLEQTIGERGWGDAEWGVLVHSLDAGETLFERNADLPLAPASNLKILTSAAALEVLGPEYRFQTYLLTDGTVRDGVLHGDLIVYGTGDPGISRRFYRSREEVFDGLVDQLGEAGIHTVAGDVVADASYFRSVLRHDDWDPRDLNEHFTAPVSALSYNENVVSFRIVSEPVGEQPGVETVPAHSALRVVNAAAMSAAPRRPRLAILRDDPLEPVRVIGNMVAGTRDVWRQMTVADPAAFFGASFLAALEDRGVAVAGGWRVVHEPVGSSVQRIVAPAAGRPGLTVLARHTSRPLRDYLEVVNKESNNLYAELVLRAVGRAKNGVGSFESGARAVRTTLAELGVDTTGLVQLDGSGLAFGNRVTARTFVETLERMSEGPRWDDLWETLPVAGSRRGLGRMYRTAAAGNLRAKTGTIEGVSALSGVVRSRDGERLAFSIMVNETPSQNRAKRVENLIGARLAAFRRAPGAVPARVVAEASQPRSERHRVERGENLSAIAYRYGLRVQEILQLNPDLSPNRIMPGEWIELPARDR